MLEAKLTKMVKLEPTVKEAVNSVNALVKLPTKEQVSTAEAEAKRAITKVETAVKNEKSDTEKNGVIEEAKEVAPLQSVEAGKATPTGEFIAAKTNVKKVAPVKINP